MNNNYKHTVANTHISPTSLKADRPIAPEASLSVNIFKRHRSDSRNDAEFIFPRFAEWLQWRGPGQIRTRD